MATFTDFDQASGLMRTREGDMSGGTGLIHSQVDCDLNGNLKQRIDNKLPTPVTEDYFYDTLNRFDRSMRTPAGGATTTNADVTLDAIGYVRWKQGVGSYGYDATQNRAVIAAGSNSYDYDTSGNITSTVEQTQSGDGKPDLGPLGNTIRFFVDTPLEQSLFERYWLGLGDLVLSQSQFDEINSLLPQTSASLSEGMYNFVGGDHNFFAYKRDFYGTKYDAGLGRAWVIYDADRRRLPRRRRQ